MGTQGFTKAQLEAVGRFYARKYAAFRPVKLLKKLMPKTPEGAVSTGLTAMQAPMLFDTSSVKPTTRV